MGIIWDDPEMTRINAARAKDASHREELEAAFRDYRIEAEATIARLTDALRYIDGDDVAGYPPRLPKVDVARAALGRVPDVRLSPREGNEDA